MDYIVGVLQENENGKFDLYTDQGEFIRAYDDGDTIECLIEGEWYVGRVLLRMNGEAKEYIFHAEYRPALYNGLRARIKGE
jgi:hypothetical protein